MFDGIRLFRCAYIPTVPLLNAARTCHRTGDRARTDLPGPPSCSGHVLPLLPRRCGNGVSFRVAAYRGTQSFCHKKKTKGKKDSKRPTRVCHLAAAAAAFGRFSSIAAQKTFKLQLTSYITCFRMQRGLVRYNETYCPTRSYRLCTNNLSCKQCTSICVEIHATRKRAMLKNRVDYIKCVGANKIYPALATR